MKKSTLTPDFCSAPVVMVHIQCVYHDSRCAKHLTQVKSVVVCSECDATTPPTGTVTVICSGFSILSNHAFCVYYQPMRKRIPH